MSTVLGSSCAIPLASGETMLVSPQDRTVATAYQWRTTSTKKKYARAHVEGEYQLFHRFVLGLKRGDKATVDHINGDSLDNRRSNLRVCTAQENCWNRRATNSKLGLYGVWQEKRSGMFVAKFKNHGQDEYIGYFDTAVEAAYAYNKRVSALRGEFAALNTIDRTQLQIALKRKIESMEQRISELKKDMDDASA